MPELICGIHLGNEALQALALRVTKRELAVAGGVCIRLPGSGGVPADSDPQSKSNEEAEKVETVGCEVELVAPLRQLTRGLHLQDAQIVLSVPKQQGILRSALLPSTDPDELEQMARFEIERHIPFHQERHSTGFHVMRSMGVEGSEVLLGAVDSPVIERVLGGALGAGLMPRGLTLSSAALVNALLHERRDALAGKTVAVLNVGLDALDLVLLTEDRVRFARSVGLDLRHVLEDWGGLRPDESGAPPDIERLALAARSIDCMDLEGHYSADETGTAVVGTAEPARVRAWIGRLIQELRRTYDFARREMKCPPIELVMLTGCGARLRNLAQYLKTNLSLEVEVLNPVASLPGAAELKFPFDGLEFAMAFGAAIARIAPGMYQLDLIPPEYYRAQMRRRTVRRLAVTGSLLAIALGLGCGAWQHRKSINERIYNDYHSFNEKMAPRVAELEEMRVKLGIIQNFQDDPNAATAVLASIANSHMIPGAVTLSSIDYTKGGAVEIQGDAKTIPDINAFMDDLRTTGHFPENLEMNPEQNFAFNQLPLYHFKIVATLNEMEAKAVKGAKL